MGYPVDISGATAFAAFGLRRLRAAYSGNFVALRRLTDSATRNVGAVVGGDAIDMSDVASWLGIPDTIKGWQDAYASGNVAVVTSWIDQSTNGTRTLASVGTPPILRRDLQGYPCLWFGPSGHLSVNYGSLALGYTMATSGYCHAPGLFLGGTSDIYAGATAITMSPYNAFGGTSIFGPLGNANPPVSVVGERHTGIATFGGTGAAYFNYDGTDYGPVSAGTSVSQNGVQINSISVAGARRSYTVCHEFIVWAVGSTFDPTIRANVNADMRGVYPSGPVPLPAGGGIIVIED